MLAIGLPLVRLLQPYRAVSMFLESNKADPLLKFCCGSHLTQHEDRVLQEPHGRLVWPAAPTALAPSPCVLPELIYPLGAGCSLLRSSLLRMLFPRYYVAPPPPSLSANSGPPQAPCLFRCRLPDHSAFSSFFLELLTFNTLGNFLCLVLLLVSLTRHNP